MTNNYPKITVVTPSYNQGQYLEKTIRSVINQNYPNLEYIVMDGGSTDQSVEIIQKYSKYITYWESQPDKGQADAIKRGFDKGTGEIYSWINSDDLLCKNSLFHVAKAYQENKNAGLFYGDSFLINQKDELIRAFLCQQVNYEQLIHGSVSIFQGSTFYVSKAYHEVGGLNDSLHYAMEYEILYKIAKLYPTQYINNFLGCFRNQPLAKSSTPKWIEIGRREKQKIILDIDNTDNQQNFYKIKSLFYSYKRRLIQIMKGRLYAQNKQNYHKCFDLDISHII